MIEFVLFCIINTVKFLLENSYIRICIIFKNIVYNSFGVILYVIRR